ncbi:hypothetical protein ANCCAN_17743 [Ancylostoma caninum]|uniref:Uncharacterized protein n=1 Tax=Ancylostoma caninum TaxID=29170 RepID=A0A368FW01_ANCCA|nr:hypothetical protein ANCCAN_17743 [Ancylostoma caninum]
MSEELKEGGRSSEAYLSMFQVYYKNFGTTVHGKTEYKICNHAMCSRTHFGPIGDGAYARITRFGLLQFGVLASPSPRLQG